jgi:hypothetical protein
MNLVNNHQQALICFQGAGQQGLKPELKHEADENQGDRVPGLPEDEFSDEDQMVGLIHLNTI